LLSRSPDGLPTTILPFRSCTVYVHVYVHHLILRSSTTFWILSFVSFTFVHVLPSFLTFWFSRSHTTAHYLTTTPHVHVPRSPVCTFISRSVSRSTVTVPARSHHCSSHCHHLWILRLVTFVLRSRSGYHRSTGPGFVRFLHLVPLPFTALPFCSPRSRYVCFTYTFTFSLHRSSFGFVHRSTFVPTVRIVLRFTVLSTVLRSRFYISTFAFRSPVLRSAFRSWFLVPHRSRLFLCVFYLPLHHCVLRSHVLGPAFSAVFTSLFTTPTTPTVWIYIFTFVPHHYVCPFSQLDFARSRSRTPLPLSLHVSLVR